MLKFLSFILLLLMSVAFTAEVMVAHKGIAVAAFAKEEEKVTEEKKAKEDHLSTCCHAWQATLLPHDHHTTAAFETAALPAGHHSRPFTPPDMR